MTTPITLLRTGILLCGCLLVYGASAQVELGVRNFSPIHTYQSGRLFSGTPTHFRTGAGAPWQRIGYFGGRLEKQMPPNAAAQAHMQRYRAAKWINTGCAIGAFGAGITAIAYTLPRLGAAFGVQSEPGPGITQKPGFWFALAGAFAIGGIVARDQAGKRLEKAVFAYNSDLSDFPVQPPKWELRLRPGRPGTVGLWCTVNF
ncbi:MAG: hypothetical protein H6575_20400 [Lewinellaceae bacterium]|nr:hypothetical protein [Lewinellaceae bacterium]